MSEFSPDIAVITKADGEIRMRSLSQLLPESFQLDKEDSVLIPEDEPCACEEEELL